MWSQEIYNSYLCQFLHLSSNQRECQKRRSKSASVTLSSLKFRSRSMSSSSACSWWAWRSRIYPIVAQQNLTNQVEDVSRHHENQLQLVQRQERLNLKMTCKHINPPIRLLSTNLGKSSQWSHWARSESSRYLIKILTTWIRHLRICWRASTELAHANALFPRESKKHQKSCSRAKKGRTLCAQSLRSMISLIIFLTKIALNRMEMV